MTTEADHICVIHGAPCRGRDSQDYPHVPDRELTEAELERGRLIAAEVVDELVNQRTRTA
jgi:hypothetical protein